ncbi:transglutaminase-like cysteine peptidase [Hahella ganghwensis]|uniref:transglutaminase-like cysteine peptidase n=1 Tax=Hahella ganghwensis TaxID=286420 RepID=UPI0003756131|nr:transglutaminase-like cysteine peptidase [Hahella ganghwensis]
MLSFKNLRAKTVIIMFACWAVLASAAFEISLQVLSSVEKEFGSPARDRLERWQRLLNTPKDLAEDKKLMLVNSFFNQTDFISDIEHWGREDYWATPMEFLITNGGDCEDYSIAKYFALRELGVSDEKLRITYVKALRLNQAHMVLAYYAAPDAEPLILDNLIKDIRPGSQRDDLYPIYSFNGDGLWLSKQRGLGKKVGESSKLSQWNELNERLLKQLQASL